MVRRLSRLQKVRKKREARQAVFYLILAVSATVVVFIWGIPAFARLAGFFLERDDITLTENNDLLPPPPILSSVPEATPSGQLDVEGFARSGSEVILFLNNAEKDSVVADDLGNFAFKGVRLSAGKNVIYAVARLNNKESEKSRIYEVTYDESPPEISISSPEDGARFSGESERVVRIAGSVDEDTENVMVGGRVAILTPEGEFSVNYQLAEGEQEIVIEAVDRAGNRSQETLTLFWES